MFWRPSEDSGGSAFLGGPLERSSSTGEGGEAVLIVPSSSSNNNNSRVPTHLVQSEIEQSRAQLPIFACRHEILYALEEHETVILVGETGSGKSTQLVQYLRAANWTDGGRLMVASTQPRRVGATMLAARVAQEMGAEVGGLVGYKIRFDSKLTKLAPGSSTSGNGGGGGTEILFLTDGMMVQEVLRDPLLSAYSVVVVDEAHERSASSDLLLALLKKVQRRRRQPLQQHQQLLQREPALKRLSSLRLVVASATLDASAMATFFRDADDEAPGPGPGAGSAAGASAPPAIAASSRVAVLHVPGRQHAVELCYLAAPCRDYIQQTVDTVLAIHHQYPAGGGGSAGQRGPRGRGGGRGADSGGGGGGGGGGGDVLVFLPGKEEIALVLERLSFAMDNDNHGAGLAQTLVVLPLHGSLPRHQQLRAFDAAPSGRRKVVLATNIAETSLTLPSISFVVDSCLHRVPYHDHSAGSIQFLVTEPVSQAAATQRAGRAGRCGPGRAFRLCTQAWFNQLPSAAVPEMQRSDLAWPVLQLLSLGVANIASFDFVSPPPAAAVARALELLHSLNAVDNHARVTATGLAIARLGTNPRMGRALLWALQEGCAEEMLDVAAMCSVESPFLPPASASSARDKERERERERERAKRKRGAADAASGARDGVTDFVDLSGDHLTLMRLLRGFDDSPEAARGAWCSERDVSLPVLRRALSVRAALRRALVAAARSWGGVGETAAMPGELVLASCGDDSPRVLRCLVGGFFSNVVRLGPDGAYHPLAPPAQAAASPPMHLHASSVLTRFASGAGSDYVLFQEAEGVAGALGPGSVSGLLSGRGTGFVVRLREASKVRAAWLLQMAPHYFAQSAVRK